MRGLLFLEKTHTVCEALVLEAGRDDSGIANERFHTWPWLFIIDLGGSEACQVDCSGREQWWRLGRLQRNPVQGE